jgi:protease-4
MERYLPLVLDRIKNGRGLDVFKREETASFALGGRDPISGLPVLRSFPRVAFIPVIGGVTKHGDLCSYGMRELGLMVQAANESENVDAILFEFDSPGGTVDGTQELGTIIAMSAKPTVGFCDNQTASAGYWLASQCDYLYANSLNNTEIGSIGTLYVHVNQAKKIENEVGEVTIFRASQSVDKARINSIEPLTEELKAEIIDELTEITEAFKATVTNGRGNRLSTGNEDIFTGKMYPKKQALKMGMIDAIGTFAEAAEKASTLARTGGHKKIRNSKTQDKNAKSMSLKDWFNKPKEESAEETTVTAEAAELAQLKADMIEANSSVETATAKITALETTIQEKDARIAELESQVTELEKTPAESKSTVAHTGDNPPTTLGEEKEMTSWEKKAANIKSKKISK